MTQLEATQYKMTRTNLAIDTQHADMNIRKHQKRIQTRPLTSSTSVLKAHQRSSKHCHENCITSIDRNNRGSQTLTKRETTADMSKVMSNVLSISTPHSQSSLSTGKAHNCSHMLTVINKKGQEMKRIEKYRKNRNGLPSLQWQA